MSTSIYYINGKQQFNSDISFNNVNTLIRSSQNITISGGSVSIIGPTTINGSSAVTQMTNNNWSGKNYFSDDTSVNKLYLTNTGLTTTNFDKWVNIDNSNKVVFVDLSATGNYTSFGGHSLMKNKTAWGSSAFGYDAMRNISTRTDISFSNTAVGTGSMIGGDPVLGITGMNNTAIGRGALASITSGSSNVAVGTNTLSGITSASNNTIVGANSNINNNLSNSQILGSNNSCNHSNVNIIGTNISSTGDYRTYINNISNSTNSTTSNISIYNPATYELTYCTDMIQKSLNNTQFISQQGVKLFGIDYFGPSLQGKSISVSSDGNTLAVGGSGDNGSYGAVWIWKRNSTMWTKDQKIIIPTADIAGSSSVINAGCSVALSGTDGNTLAIGATGDNNGVGAVWIWTRTSSSQPYTKLQKIVGTSYITVNSPVNQGCSVSLSNDGNTLAFGGLGDNSGNGATWVWTRSSFGNQYTQLQKIIGTGSVTFFSNVFQGCSVSLSGIDGNTLAIGGLGDSTNMGAVWIFTRPSFGNTFTQQGTKLVGSTSSGKPVNQGCVVELSDDGYTLAFGGISDNGGIGAVWVFLRYGGIWTQQDTKIVGSGSVGSSSQGSALSLSTDGNTLAIGGSNDNGGVGAVWIWTRSDFGQTYYQQGQKIIGAGNTSNGSQSQGISVALLGDTSMLFVGGSSDTSSIGAVWAFPKSTNNIYMGNYSVNNTIGANLTDSQTRTQIIQQARLVATNVTNNSQQGSSVAISSDGTIMAVGSPNDNTGSGSVWIWNKVGSSWSLNQKIEVLSDSGFGTSVAFQSNGSGVGYTLAVGAPIDTSSNSAGVYIFTLINDPEYGLIFEQQGTKIIPTFGGVSSQAGCSVALSDNGNTLVFGGKGYNGETGATWIWTRSGTTWSQQARLIGITVSSTPSLQGLSVAISGDGNTVIIGGPNDNNYYGAAWVFTRSGVTWTQKGNKITGSTAYITGNQGYSVAISNDGNLFIVGSPSDMGGVGTTLLFTAVGNTFVSYVTPALIGTGNIGYSNQGYSLAISRDGLTLVVGAKYDNNYIGAIWVWVRSAIGKPFYQYGPKAVGSGNIGKSQQGYSVAVSSDGSTMVSGGFGDGGITGIDGGVGATWVFTKNSTNTSINVNNQYMSIGTSIPSAPLTVTQNNSNGGSALLSSALDMYNSNIGGTFQRYFSNNQTSAYWHVGSEVGDGIQNFPFHIYNQAGTGVYITSGSQSWTGYSDKRLKKNIQDIDIADAHKKMLQLNPVNYSLLTDTDEHPDKQGLIAQDVLSVFPQIVSMNHGYYGIGYTELIPYMIASIKHQHSLIEKQNDMNDAQQKQLEVLKMQNSSLIMQNVSIMTQNKELKIENETLTNRLSAVEERISALESKTV